MICRIFAAAMLLAIQAFAGKAYAEPVALQITPVALLQSDLSRRRVGELEFLAGFEIAATSERWGGVSGAVLDPGGGSIVAVSDRGMWVRFGLRHDADGRLVALDALAELVPLLDRNGKALADPGQRDAEAVSRVAGGGLLVAFQGADRLWRYGPAKDALTSAAKPFQAPRGLRRAAADKGVTALTALPREQLMMLSGSDFNRTGDVRGWLRRNGRWSEIGWVPVGEFRPSDMAAMPNGEVILLSRKYSAFNGYSARLSIIGNDGIIPLARLRDREIAVIAEPLTVDNFEAVAVRSASDGSALIYLLSDDRHSMLHRTLLLQFRWREREVHP